MINQIKDFCECVQDATDKDVVELINVISMATGWMREPCETLMADMRREVIDLPSCQKCAFVFDPYYHPFDETTFKFYLVTVDGTVETKEEITDFQYHESDKKVYLNLPNRCGCVSLCGCDPEYKLIAEYSAGYELLPECLLPVFCNALAIVRDKNKCCCESCGCEVPETPEYPTGDNVSAQLEIDLGRMFVELYKSQLAMLNITRDTNMWGVIV